MKHFLLQRASVGLCVALAMLAALLSVVVVAPASAESQYLGSVNASVVDTANGRVWAVGGSGYPTHGVVGVFPTNGDAAWQPAALYEAKGVGMDSASVYVSAADGVHVFDRASAAHSGLLPIGVGEPGSLVVAGGRIWFGLSCGGVDSLGSMAPDGSSIERFADAPGRPCDPLLLPDAASDDRFYAMQQWLGIDEYVIVHYDVSTGQPVVVDSAVFSTPVIDIAISPDGDRAVVVLWHGPGPRAIELDAGLQPTGLEYSFPGAFIGAVEYAPDGDRLAIGGEPDPSTGVSIARYAEGESQPLQKFQSRVACELGAVRGREGSLRWTSGGSLYAFEYGYGSMGLREVDEFAKIGVTLSMSASASTARPHEIVTFSGQLAFDDDPTPEGIALDFERTWRLPPDDLGPVVTDARGAFSIDVPMDGIEFDAEGHCFSLWFDGDADHQAWAAVPLRIRVEKAGTWLRVDARELLVGPNQAFAVTGRLDEVEGPPLTHRTVHVYEADSNEVTASTTTDDSGRFKVVLPGRSRGRYEYRVSWMGDGQTTQSGARITVNVTRVDSKVRVIAPDRASFDQPFSVRANLAFHEMITDPRLKIFALPWHGTPRLVAKGPLDEHGNLRVEVSAKVNTIYSAVFPGRGAFRPSEARDKILIAPRMRGRLLRAAGRQGEYRLYAPGVDPVFAVDVSPPLAVATVDFYLEEKRGGRWSGAGYISVPTTASGLAAVRVNGAALTTGRGYRIQAAVSNNRQTGSAETANFYFRVVRGRGLIGSADDPRHAAVLAPLSLQGLRDTLPITGWESSARAPGDSRRP